MNQCINNNNDCKWIALCNNPKILNVEGNIHPNKINIICNRPSQFYSQLEQKNNENLNIYELSKINFSGVYVLTHDFLQDLEEVEQTQCRNIICYRKNTIYNNRCLKLSFYFVDDQSSQSCNNIPRDIQNNPNSWCFSIEDSDSNINDDIFNIVLISNTNQNIIEQAAGSFQSIGINIFRSQNDESNIEPLNTIPTHLNVDGICLDKSFNTPCNLYNVDNCPVDNKVDSYGNVISRSQCSIDFENNKCISLGVPSEILDKNTCHYNYLLTGNCEQNCQRVDISQNTDDENYICVNKNQLSCLNLDNENCNNNEDCKIDTDGSCVSKKNIQSIFDSTDTLVSNFKNVFRGETENSAFENILEDSDTNTSSFENNNEFLISQNENIEGNIHSFIDSYKST